MCLEVVEADKGLNVALGSRVVKLSSLFPRHVGENFTDADLLGGTLVEQANAQSNKRGHFFLQHHACRPVLHDDVGVVLAKIQGGIVQLDDFHHHTHIRID